MVVDHGFFQRLYLLRCDYFLDVRMNGGGCDRCLAWTMVHGARTPFQENNNGILRAAAPIDPSPWSFAQPFAQPTFCSPRPHLQNVSCVCFALYALCVSTPAATFGGRVTRSACVARLARSSHGASAVACRFATGVLCVLQNLICQQSYLVVPPKFQPPLYDHRLPREDCGGYQVRYPTKGVFVHRIW